MPNPLFAIYPRFHAAANNTGVAAKRALNRRIRAGLWGFTQTAIANAMQSTGGLTLKLPAMDSSRTDAACGHVDAENRKAKLLGIISVAWRHRSERK